MAKSDRPARNPLSVRQRGSAGIAFGEHVRARVSVSVTPAGLLAIGGLVAGILLSIPPIVRAARDTQPVRLPPPGA